MGTTAHNKICSAVLRARLVNQMVLKRKCQRGREKRFERERERETERERERDRERKTDRASERERKDSVRATALSRQRTSSDDLW